MAMNTIQNAQCAALENAVWAVTKFVAVSNIHFLSSVGGCELAEIQTLQIITFSANNSIALERERVRQLLGSITESQAVLREREEMLQRLTK
ncbi:hypothetical protein N7507_010508 [Penicillium longicatenatum]|nr:hypothetical protein N7507_010508 [Penicillium longicatenatum]